jgi:hypothetical protein
MSDQLPVPSPKQVLFEPFPKQQEFIDAALSGDYSLIIYGGAIRGGKTFALLALFILLSRMFPGSRWAIVRKDLPTIKKNLYPSWNKIKPGNFIKVEPTDHTEHTVTFKNGSQIIFFPENYIQDKEHNRWKGLEVNGFGFEEINECQQATLYKAFERAGSYIIPMVLGKDGVFHQANQPKPLVVGTCNPTNGWLKELVYTPNKKGELQKDWLYIQSRIYDNTPLLLAQPHYLPNLKSTLKIYEYMVFVEGDWDVQLKTGGEFLRSFELGIHVKPGDYIPYLPLFMSIDSNVYPYITLTFWQLIKTDAGGWIVRQVHEICAEDPNNTASRAAKLAVAWLREIEYTQTLRLHGDKSTKNRNNIDEGKRSFFQIINETLLNSGVLTQDKIISNPPPVSSIADFVNAILGGDIPGLSVEINEACKKSISDYIGTKTDKDGTILKKRIPHPTIKGVTYEEFGHCVDAMKDFIIQSFMPEYIAYVNRHKKLIPGGVSQPKRTSNITF